MIAESADTGLADDHFDQAIALRCLLHAPISMPEPEAPDPAQARIAALEAELALARKALNESRSRYRPVSYTHLTLPTKA